MDAKECADILRATISHRERMHQKEVTLIGPNGEEMGAGKINPEADCLYQAMKFALPCVEEKIREWDTAQEERLLVIYGSSHNFKGRCLTGRTFRVRLRFLFATIEMINVDCVLLPNLYREKINRSDGVCNRTMDSNRIRFVYHFTSSLLCAASASILHQSTHKGNQERY